MMKIRVLNQKQYIKVKLLEFVTKQYLIISIISSISIFLI